MFEYAKYNNFAGVTVITVMKQYTHYIVLLEVQLSTISQSSTTVLNNKIICSPMIQYKHTTWLH